MNPITMLIVGVALQVAGYMMQSSLIKTQPKEITDMEAPTASAGRPIPFPFGDRRIPDPNILWFGDKQTVQRAI